jgi:chromate transporter
VALSDDPPEWVRGVGAGAAAAAVAVIAQAGLGLARGALQDRGAAAVVYLVAGAVAALVAGPLVVLVLVACGLVELGRRRAGAAVVAWPAALALAASAVAELPPLTWTALKVGGLAFGGGFVIVPLMQGDATGHGWMTATQYANAVAYGQITPGPVTHTIALVGWAAAGASGALLASAIAFAPSFLFVLLGGERFERLRAGRGPRAFRDGAGPAAVGAILGAALVLAGALGPAWQWIVLAGAGAVLALRRPPIEALLGGAVAGLVAALAGAALP